MRAVLRTPLIAKFVGYVRSKLQSRHENWLDVALLVAKTAAHCETAADSEGLWIRRLTRDRLQAALTRRQRCQQALCVRMCGRVQDIHCAPLFHNFSRVVHSDAIRHRANDSDVVRNQDHGCVLFALQFLQKRKDLCLESDIQSRRRLVSDQHARMTRERDCDHHALPLPSAELVRELLRRAFRGRHFDRAQLFDG